MKSKVIELKLKFKGETVHFLTSDSITKEVSIGRKAECDLIVPSEDKLAGGIHAFIRKKGKQLFIADNDSRNGLFFNGKKITTHKLNIGDKITIGGCLLEVNEKELSVNSKSSAASYNKLEFVNTSKKGKIVEINRDSFYIGSDGNCHFKIDENLISSQHAVITVKGNDCWLKDLGSTNGTKVNSTSLVGDKERLLRDNDVLTFAFVECRFLDKNIVHARSYALLKIVTVIMTLALLMLGYFSYLATSPNAYDLIQKARQVAAMEKFDEALKVLESARNAREYSKYKTEHGSLVKQIRLWKGVAGEWNLICDYVRAKKWVGVVRELSTMQYERMETWNWNENKAVSMKNLAVKLKNSIDTYLKVQSACGNDDMTLAEMQGIHRELDELLAGKLSGKQEEVIQGLVSEMRKLAEQLDENEEQEKKLNKIITRLSQRYVKLQLIIDDLQILEKESCPIVKKRVEQYLTVLRKLRLSQKVVLNNTSALKALKLDQISDDLNLPTVDECSIDSYINSHRMSLNNSYENLMAAKKQVEYVLERMKRYGLKPSHSVELLDSFCSEDNWLKVAKCDILDSKLPRRSRTAPNSAYDRMLGLEFFYDLLKTYPEKYDEGMLEVMNFTPECVVVKEIFDLCSNFVKFTDLPRNRWLKKDEVNGLRLYCLGLLKKRDELVHRLYGKEADSVNRELVIKRAAALYLAPVELYGTDSREKLAKDICVVRRVVSDLNNHYDSATPEKAIAIREEILTKGLPGDSAVRKVWATKSYK